MPENLFDFPAFLIYIFFCAYYIFKRQLLNIYKNREIIQPCIPKLTWNCKIKNQSIKMEKIFDFKF